MFETLLANPASDQIFPCGTSESFEEQLKI